MLVAAFQIKIDREVEFILVRTAHYRGVRGARVKPHVQNVGGLVILLGFFSTHEIFRFSLSPGFDAALFDAFGDFFHDFKRARMQLARYLVGEEGKRHTPVALTRDTPVRTVGDHGVQTVVTPARVELRGIHRFKRSLAKTLGLFGTDGRTRVIVTLIHTDKPLARCTVDQGRLVAPAVHIAVNLRAVVQKVTGFFQFFNDNRLRFPNVQATEEGKVVGVNTVALHRIEDVIVVHAVLLAGVEVVHTVGRRRVNNTGTGR